MPNLGLCDKSLQEGTSTDDSAAKDIATFAEPHELNSSEKAGSA